MRQAGCPAALVVVLVLCCLALAGSARAEAVGKCVVSIGGKVVDPATHAIVTPRKPTPQETFAAKDLQAHLEKLTGKTVAIVREGALGDKTPLVVGKCAAVLKKLGVRIDFDKLGHEGIVVRTGARR